MAAEKIFIRLLKILRIRLERDMTIQPVLYLCGETASGKSALALEIAKKHGGEIVNADVYQAYCGLETISAAPDAAELAQVPHHLYSVIDASTQMDAVRYTDMAREVIAEIQARDALPIVVGGSSLYLKFLTHGPSPAPPGDEKLRAELDQEELSDLAKRLQELDPEEAERQNLQNRRHVSRALEICLLSGQKASDLRKNWEDPTLVESLRGILLKAEREPLDAKIKARIEHMMENGAIDEVKNLPADAATAAKAIGVPEIRTHLAGNSSLQDCKERIFFATRQYAKRQRNWFRKETWLREISTAEIADGGWEKIVGEILS